MNLAICFSQTGPYHLARIAALRDLLQTDNVFPVEVASLSKTYQWEVLGTSKTKIATLCGGTEEEAAFLQVFWRACLFWRSHKIDVAFLPSYSPQSSLALLLSAKLGGVRCIMMNESHAGTERARGFKRWVKRRLVGLFDGAIVGGEPHRRHFISLGMPAQRIVTGYDSIDNAYFSSKAAEVLQNSEEVRRGLNLPRRYFLNLGRLVDKKNLCVLVEAFAQLKKSRRSEPLGLVFVGSGESQSALLDTCQRLGLIYSLNPAEDVNAADVLFYGFRQIDQNPAFYALAEAFVLPSLYEEWGLVVNEAMACGLPVLVSSKVGSAEDLVVPGENGFHFDPEAPDELARQMAYLLDNPKARDQMGRASSERIKAWGWENFAKRAKEVLEITGF